MSGNRKQLPDTQELTQDSQAFNMSLPKTELPAWGNLVYLIDDKCNIDLHFDKILIGRDPPIEEDVEFFEFNEENCPLKYLSRISRCHMEITLEEPLSDMDNLRPAVLKVNGQNGVYINNEKLAIGTERILSHKDIIKLTSKACLFRFFYKEAAPDISSLPKACLLKYHIGTQVGSGGCGIVRLVRDLKTREKFAMKLIQKEITNPLMKRRDQANEKILNEVEIMKNLHHCNVLSLVDCYETVEKVVIVMHYMEGRDMLHRITQFGLPQRKCLSEADSKFFFTQICHGLQYLHGSGITHRDIKPDNILLDTLTSEATVKISDFGLSKLLSVESMKTVCGTQLYVAPEVLIGGTYTNKVDIWSLGCLLYAMLSGCVPFSPEYKPHDLTHQIRNALFSFKQNAWQKVSKNAKDLIKQMLQKDPTMRPSISKILEHSWVRCPETISRIARLRSSDDTIQNMSGESEIENTLKNISLDGSIKQPPLKKRRVDQGF